MTVSKKPPTRKKINKNTTLVFGLGAFGFAMLRHLGRAKKEKESIGPIMGYEPLEDVQTHLHQQRKHPTLYTNKTYELSDAILFPLDLKKALSLTDILILAIPTHVLFDVWQKRIKPYVQKSITILNLAKGLEKDGKLFSEKFLQEGYKNYAMLAGGMIAEDFFDGKQLGCTIGVKSRKIGKKLMHLLATSTLFVETTSDVAGVECAAAFKNVGSLLVGWLMGKGCSLGTITYYLSKFTQEIALFAKKVYNTNVATFGMTKQCWGNDFTMSCFGNTRNKMFGELLGKGMSFREACEYAKKYAITVEGIQTLTILDNMLKKLNYTDFPLLQSCTKLLYDKCEIGM